jgi:hypothetical protein
VNLYSSSSLIFLSSRLIYVVEICLDIISVSSTHHEEHRNLFYNFGIIDCLNCLVLQGEFIEKKISEMDEGSSSLSYDELISFERNLISTFPPSFSSSIQESQVILPQNISNSLMTYFFSYSSIFALSFPSHPLIHFFLSLLSTANILTLDDDPRAIVGKGFERMNRLFKCGYVISLVEFTKKAFNISELQKTDNNNSVKELFLGKPLSFNIYFPISFENSNFDNPLSVVLHIFNSDPTSLKNINTFFHHKYSSELFLISQIFDTLSSLSANKEICTSIHQSKLTSVLSNLLTHSVEILNKLSPFINSLDSPVFSPNYFSIHLLISTLLLIKNTLSLFRSLSHDDSVKNFFSTNNNSKTLFDIIYLINLCVSIKMKNLEVNNSIATSSPSSNIQGNLISLLDLIISTLEEASSAFSSLSLRNKHLGEVFSFHYSALHPGNTSESLESLSSSDFTIDPYLNYPDAVSSLIYALRTSQLTQQPSVFIPIQIHLCNSIRNMASRSPSLKKFFLVEYAEKTLRNSLNFNQNRSFTSNTSQPKKKAKTPLYEAAHAALRDLGCDVELTELWKGTGKELKR